MREEKKQMKAEISEMQGELLTLQQEIKKAGISVFVLVEGFAASGKGSLINRLITCIDPRFYRVYSMDRPSPEETRRHFLYRYFRTIPEQGKFTFLDSGWPSILATSNLERSITSDTYKRRIEFVKQFERSLTENGYLLVKIFLNIDEDEQKCRLNRLLADQATAWRVSEHDAWEAKNYCEVKAAYQEIMEKTDSPFAPWHVIEAKKPLISEFYALRYLIDAISDRLHNGIDKKSVAKYVPKLSKPISMPLLHEVDLSLALPREDYEERLKKDQKRLRELHNHIYARHIPVVLLFEGWDAAGKGGAIKRVTQALDARGYEVNPVASPTPPEKNRHYLWRFWEKMPKTGHIALFDRTWYGRVMVERIEGFCDQKEWKRAYREMNEFEYQLASEGTIVIKFWLQIDKDVQLARFNERQETPEKQWKITDEDWRNREKWDAYEEAVNDMLQKTSTEYAPWHIIEGNDKLYARVKTIEIIIDALENALEKPVL